MSYSIGDGMTVVAIAGGIVGYLYIKHLDRQKKLEVIHQERMAAMEKGIPLPEFPLEQPRERREPNTSVISILGLVLLCLSIGTMIVLHTTLDHDSRSFSIAPLPFAFLGVGFLAYPLLKGPWRR
jgi:Na+/glutamate symporter